MFGKEDTLTPLGLGCQWRSTYFSYSSFFIICAIRRPPYVESNKYSANSILSPKTHLLAKENPKLRLSDYLFACWQEMLRLVLVHYWTHWLLVLRLNYWGQLYRYHQYLVFSISWKYIDALNANWNRYQLLKHYS